MSKAPFKPARFLKMGSEIAVTLLLCTIAFSPFVVEAAETPAHNTAVGNAADDTGFQPLDLNKVEKVNGKSHAIVAYCIIFGVFILYAISLLKREKTVEKEARKLERQLENFPQ